jgi:phosphoribosyl-ATP pyrophosphohydrolase
MNASDQYLCEEINKGLGKVIELLEKMMEEARKINPEIIAESNSRMGNDGADMLVHCHKMITNMAKNVDIEHLALMIFALSSKDGTEVEEEVDA